MKIEVSFVLCDFSFLVLDVQVIFILFCLYCCREEVYHLPRFSMRIKKSLVSDRIYSY